MFSLLNELLLSNGGAMFRQLMTKVSKVSDWSQSVAFYVCEIFLLLKPIVQRKYNLCPAHCLENKEGCLFGSFAQSSSVCNVQCTSRILYLMCVDTIKKTTRTFSPV